MSKRHELNEVTVGRFRSWIVRNVVAASFPMYFKDATGSLHEIESVREYADGICFEARRNGKEAA
jgi:hypothetical protein